MKIDTLLSVLFLLLSPIALLAQEKDCTYKIDDDRVRVRFEAFKAPTKIGVSGQFDDFKIQSEHEGKSIMEIIKGTKFSIDPKSIQTKDPARNQNIVNFFFKTMVNPSSITGEIQEIKNDQLIVLLSMNGNNVPVSMSFSEHNGNFKATGYLDIFDFAMQQQLKSLTQACKEQHEGKTWSDVAIEVSALFKKKCI